ncbi:cobalamin-5'-phosphate synthase [Dysgonomonas macrotermitis]|uniref:Adenosylcobinamide-GDP ribazoletransferase n=2 Tax=Dysgonomonas macrotermitis TaxID=1346286 RepID=A0A1M5FIH6_9BACT|nr:cobalamin-5'-phosphate synthase [Dysgonomonas macrotermitis]
MLYLCYKDFDIILMNNLAAALIFFTRIPFWRIFKVPDENFKQVINYWAVVGWLTAPVMAGVLWFAALVMPFGVACVLAIISRLLITGALHEDGLADFFDGFGGGSSKERILAIMKDSHIGTYGVLGLISYYLLLFQTLSLIPVYWSCIGILVADPLCKFIGSLITLRLPYARNEESSKAKVVYNKMAVYPFLVSAVFGLLPLVLLLPYIVWTVAVLPVLVFFGLTWLMRNKIGGYTGDCCGALFLLCELSFYLGYTIVVYNSGVDI